MIALALALLAGSAFLVYLRVQRSGLLSDDSEERLGMTLVPSLPAASAFPASSLRLAVLVAGPRAIDAEAVRAALARRWGGAVTCTERGRSAFALGTGRITLLLEVADAPLDDRGLPDHGGVVAIGDIRGSAPAPDQERFAFLAAHSVMDSIPTVGWVDRRSGRAFEGREGLSPAKQP